VRLQILAQGASTIVVVGLLAGLGLYGHYNGWKVPKFLQLVGAAEAQPDDWCTEHGVPESQCVQCRPNLLSPGKDFGWCRQHGIHNCPLEHAEIVQLKEPPAVLEVDRQRAARALALMPRAENNGVCKNYRRRIQFASLEAVKKAGVDVALVDRQPMRESISAAGEIRYDETRLAHLASRLAGTVVRVEKQLGDPVRAGEVLAVVDAADLGRAKTELIQALAQEELQRQTLARRELLSDTVARQQLQEAQAALAQARIRVFSAAQVLGNLGLPVEPDRLRGLSEDELLARLQRLGIPDALAGQLGRQRANANLLPLVAPADGTVVARQAVVGEVVDTSRTLFQLADTSRMWLMLNVPAEDIVHVTRGQTARFMPDGSREAFRGELTWISTAADHQTRMIAVRAELANPRGVLRNETFGTGEIILREEPQAIVVPNEAVHWEGCCHVVFVRDGAYFDKPDSPKVFHVREVRPGARNAKFTEILAGVLPDEVVATTGSDVLRAELLKNNLGEGCCSVK
jgi:multidrug efflux pump subunit AcrA (membrane-fusion protein)